MSADPTVPRPESDFTVPTPECPHPELWAAHDGDSSEVEVTEFVHALVRVLKPELVVETGACYGHTTVAIGRALQQNGRGECVAIKIDPDRARETARRCEGLPVHVLEASSLTYQPAQPVDLAFIDSDFAIREAEWRQLRPRFAVFHDTGSQHVMRHHVSRLAAEGLLTPIFLPTPRGVCLTCSL